MGGADAVLAKAQEAFDRGEYRWVAEIVNHVVFADPSNRAARELQAATLEQMGYQSESGTWRGLFLTGAQELRTGVTSVPFDGTASPDSIKAMSLQLLFNFLGVRLNGPKAVLELRHGSLNHSLGRTDPDADVTVTLTRTALDRVLLRETTLIAEAEAGEIAVEPDTRPLTQLLELLDTFDIWFNIIEP
jgi:alkyl sulfatase BDS1-like metallo-beta-lactamase superfamily hydrolase